MLRFVFILMMLATYPTHATEECSGEKFSDLVKRVNSEGPLSLAETEDRFSSSIVADLKREMIDGDHVYFTQFATDPDSSDYWGYESLIIVRGDCVVTEVYLSHSN